jgi:thymidylate kinase
MNNYAKPLIVEFAGLPNSGKTTSADIVGHYFGRSGLEVLLISDIALSCPISRRTRLESTAWILNQLINIVLEEKFHGKSHDIVLMDKGIFDAQAFISLTCKELNINDSQRQTLLSYAGLSTWGNLVDIVFLLDIPPELSWKRDQINQLTTKQGAIVNPSTLQTLSSCYYDVFRYYEMLNGKDRVQFIDASATSPMQVAQICKDRIQLFLDQTHQ